MIPTEVVDGNGAPIPVSVASNPIDFFDDFSWRTFLALNWPSKPAARGEADASKSVGDLAAPRVWETWKADYEAFQPGGARPTEWVSFDAVTPCVDIPFKDGGKARLLAAFAKFANFDEAQFGITLANPLVAQNQTYTRYEVRLNRDEYDFIRDKQLYSRTVLQNLTADLDFTPNSIEVKAAWRELTAAELPTAKARYYVIKARVQNPLNNNVCEDRDMALVGFHIVQKTPLRPQWVWSSFEHVDNVPDPSAPSPAAAYSYNSNKPPQTLEPSQPPPALTQSNPPIPDPTPMQVVRLQPLLTPSNSNLPGVTGTVATNARYQSALAGTVWANYQLVVTQWPTDTSVPSGAPFPDPTSSTTSVGNTTMETYNQQQTSCMDCHDLARSEFNTDFVWFINIRTQPPDPALFRRIDRMLEAKRAGRAAFAHFIATPPPAAAVTITGINPPQWTIPGDTTLNKRATIGNAAGRMQAHVNNGDVVEFAVTSGNHRVIFENSKSEQANGVWEVVPGSGDLVDLPNGQFPHYNHADAQNSRSDVGPLIQIRIKNLQPGNGILFGCNPHSESSNGTNVRMLGVLVR